MTESSPTQAMAVARGYHPDGCGRIGRMEKPYGRGINLQMGVDDVEAIMECLYENGIKPLRDIEEKWYRVGNEEVGVREFLVQDPDGYLLRFSQDIGTRKING